MIRSHNSCWSHGYRLDSPTRGRMLAVHESFQSAFIGTVQELVFGTPVDAPKLKVLRDGAPVAVTIDSESRPYRVLLLRGNVQVDVVDGIAPEYALMTRRTQGDEAGQVWLDQLAAICPQMARIRVLPTWVGLLDFETRFPSALERAMELAQA